jgi:hypothetical protein
MTDETQKTVTLFLTIEVTGEPARVAKYLELLQMELRTTVDFMDAMYSSADPTVQPPVVVIQAPIQRMQA